MAAPNEFRVPIAHAVRSDHTSEQIRRRNTRCAPSGEEFAWTQEQITVTIGSARDE